MVVCFAVVGFDFGNGALIFVVSLVAAPRTRRYRFTASVYHVLIFNTLLAAHWSFIILVSFSFTLFSRDSYESQWLFFFESQ